MKRYGPLLSDWELYFDTADGYENRLVVMRAFVGFLKNPHEKRLLLPGRCLLGGNLNTLKVEGIFTPTIRSIGRISKDETGRQLMRAVTMDGLRYYFYTDELNGYMSLMISDMINQGTLNPRRCFYLGHELYGSKYI